MKGKRFLCGVLTAFTLLTGCAKGTAEDVLGKTSISETENEQTKGTLPLEEFFWQSGEYGETEKMTSGDPIYINDYMGNILGIPDFDYQIEMRESDYYHDVLYSLRSYSIVGEEKVDYKFFIDTFDIKQKELHTKELDFSNLLGDGRICYPDKFQVLSENEFMVTVDFRDEEGILNEVKVVYLNQDFKMTKAVDIFPVIEQMDMVPDPFFAFQGTVKTDNAGNIYVCSDSLPIVNVVDDTGSVICNMEVLNASSEPAMFSMMTHDQIPIFEVADMKNRKNTLFWYDNDSGSMKIMTETNYEGVTGRCMNRYGEIYYLYGRDIVRWNAKSGVKEKVFSLAENGIGTNSAWQKIFVDSQGEFYLMDNTEDPSSLYAFSKVKEVEATSITIENIYGYDEYIGACAAEFSRKNPGCEISYHFVQDWDDRQANKTRALADMMNGKGPDMLLVDRADMLLLQEKGVLAELTDCINEDMRNNIFPAALRAGKIEEKQFGFTDSLYVSTVFVNNEVWSEDKWEITDVLQLVKENEGTLEELFSDEWAWSASGLSLFNTLVLADLEHSPFIDWESGKCDFDNTLFRQCMELCKFYQIKDVRNDMVNRNEKWRKGIKALEERKVLAMPAFIGDFRDFSEIMALAEEGCHYVGFPTQGQSGNQLEYDSFIVVNKNTEHYEKIKEFIQFSFTKEKQRKAGVATVRKDVLESYVIYPDWTNVPEFTLGGGVYFPLACKKDGTAFLEEYFELIESSEASPDHVSRVKDIIFEEAEQYFEEQYSLDKVIGIIESRVQLYLDERK